MSLEQLQKQIDIATEAMEKAGKSGNLKKKFALRQEIANFQKVLDVSKKRLKELEVLQFHCDELSTVREHKSRFSDLKIKVSFLGGLSLVLCCSSI